jgi:hypothetical protein
LKLCTVLFVIFLPHILFAQRLSGDLDGNGAVNFADFLVFASNFGKMGEAFDPASKDTVFVVVTDTVFVTDSRGIITDVHQEPTGYFTSKNITLDEQWRFISWSRGEAFGAWNAKFKNSSNSKYGITIARMTFEGKDGFQIAEDSLILWLDKFTIEAGETMQRQGNFEVDFPSLPHANSVVSMTLWVAITEL